ncbi:MAG: hypothetical protein ACK5XN_25650 [Bacteroidota bacterium]|jgi:hypothetical protein
MKTLCKYINLFFLGLTYIIIIGFEAMVAVMSYIPLRLTFSHESGMLGVFIWITLIPFFWWVTKWNKGREKDLQKLSKEYQELMVK